MLYRGPVLQQQGNLVTLQDIKTQRQVTISLCAIELIEVVE